MKKLITAVAIASAVLAAPMSMADGKASSGLNPWTDCGIGAMIFEDIAPAAAISNVIWDLGTTAVTSAGLSVNTCAGANVKTAMFIQQSYNNIIEETAIGNGEHITAMLDLLEVTPAARADVIAAVRADMAGIVSQPNYANATTAEKAELYYNALIANTAA
ncbi:DUF3015 family protein [Photobacterium sp. MCCC 1A19761]|uniref:DUF3015 family protein n=1 Tax=Photobacterium sp. MCCC 1A19761 TaxID=3115000 RepID=UPI00307D5E6E